MAVIGNTIDCITQGSSANHHAIGLDNQGEILAQVIGEIGSNKLFDNSLFALKNYYSTEEFGYYFYSLINREYDFIAFPLVGAPIQSENVMKEIDGKAILNRMIYDSEILGNASVTILIF